MNHIAGFLVLLSVLFYACTSYPVVTHIEGNGLGTYYHITIADENCITKSQIDSIIVEINNTASIFSPNSLVSKINRNETDTLNAILKQLLEISFQVCEETEGAFDFTVGALVNLWGFGKDTPIEVTEEEVEKAMKTVGYQKIKITEDRIIKENPDTQLNFNAIAKGYCVDLVAAFLSSKGLVNFLVDIGGELYVSGTRAQNCKWRVGIQKPTETKEGAIAAEEIIELQDIAVATSGNYRNYIDHNGKRVGHIINPYTGYPVENCLLSATVMASTCIFADGYATALMVMNETQTQEFVEKHPEIKTFLILNF